MLKSLQVAFVFVLGLAAASAMPGYILVPVEDLDQFHHIVRRQAIEMAGDDLSASSSYRPQPPATRRDGAP